MSQCYCDDCQEIDYCHSSKIESLIHENQLLREELKQRQEFECADRGDINALTIGFQTLQKQNKQLRETLRFIADGCLVPPDGGSPKLSDAVEAAQAALENKN